jgi:HAD superfamily hydrolase (TIGR01490 family)
MARSFAVFDLDGTLIRWQLYHAIGDALARKGLVDQEAFANVKNARMTWKKRSYEDSFKAYERTLVSVINPSVRNISIEAYSEACEEVFEEHKEQVYTYTRSLINQLKNEGYLLFAISGSPSIIVEKIAKFYGFDDFKASVLEIKEGRFTGKINVAITKKAELLKELAKIHDASWDKSIAIGDSEGDISLLELVEQPIAFNPDKGLYNYARENGWAIVIERKNVVYNLKPSNGEYLLG